MRIAYLITSYLSPDAVLRLVNTIRRGDPDGQIVLHHDVHSTPIDEDKVRAAGVHLMTSDHPIVWGDMTLEAVRWRAYRWMLDNLAEFDWIVLLSEQDYPIAPFSKIKDYLRQSGADALLPGERVDMITNPDGRRDASLRYGYSYRELPQTGLARRLPKRLRHYLRSARVIAYSAISDIQSRLQFYTFPEALELPTKVGVRRENIGYRADFPAWFHPAWFALSRRAAEHVIQFIDANPDYASYAASTIIPLESATGSILFNDPDLRVKSSALYFARFGDPESGRPDIFGIADVDELINDDRFFARKFRLGDTATLDALDAHVLQGVGAANTPIVAADKDGSEG